ncbi:thermophilic desulfurizing enzyme family protein [Fusarium langsethiae]|uniref:Thermophilic desulfurizing enzyme family protein n=1 Tax=Fusarium langsethiae TaxID=179993 RepID=A0A0N0V4V4_FUSLA|nr:thermophilic desulfurizing enzyme family protein [Fusarium langsethiae]GKU10266.1 unnamed protein product [Fusarium langsethiae]
MLINKHEENSRTVASSDFTERSVVATAPLRPMPASATALPIGAFAVTLTTLSLSLMEWRGVTIVNVYVANFFFVAVFGLLISAQWELAAGNGFAYSVYSAFGLFYAGYAAILTPSFGIAEAYGDDLTQYNNALGFFMLLWSVFVLTFLIASLPTNVVFILIFVFVELGFLFVAASYFSTADGYLVAAKGLKQAGGVFCFLAGLVGWYLTTHLLIKDSIAELPLGDTSKYFKKLKLFKFQFCTAFPYTIFVVTHISNMTTNPRQDAETDPKIYEDYKSKWSELPTHEAGWIDRAKAVSDVLAKDAPAREKANKTPRAEVALLKHSGLLKVLGPKKYGGGEQPWSLGYKVIREVAKGDGTSSSLGMLLGYHLLWSTTGNVVGSPEQADCLQELIITNNYFIGGAVNPRDSDLKIKGEGDNIVFNGFKFFNTGGVVSDLTVLEGAYEDTSDHIFAFVKTEQPGIKFSYDWDNVGLRLTESGSVRIENVVVPWKDALGWNAGKKKPHPAILGIPFASLLLPTIQLVFSNFYIGIAWGALHEGSAYTNKSTRAWPFGGDNKDKPQDEFYILATYGNFFAHLRAATALADQAAQKLDALYEHSGSAEERTKVTATARGEAAEWVASVKVTATDTGLRVTSGIFEVTGSKSTQSMVGLDRFWRDIRTHSLHDPVAYKNRELGRYQLLGEIPEPTWYT